MEIPGYDVLAEIGGTRRFRVYRGRHLRDGRPVLLKVPSHAPLRGRDAEALDREFAMLRELSGPGVPTVLELNRRSAVPCLVLEDRGLEPLSARLGGARLTPGSVLSLASGLCAVLNHLHENNVVAGALSPSGVLVDDAGRETELLDLSLAFRTSAEGMPPPASTEVTPYTSPEQTGRINRTVDYRSDFYSLGITIYELLVGRPPFTAQDPLELIHSHVAKTPVAPSAAVHDVPDAVSAVVMRLLAKDPEDRYQSALGIQHDLETCARMLSESGAITRFEPGQNDISSRFVIPQRLYGREREVEALARAFADACGGGAALLLVSGYSGVGKTSLISELYRPIVRQRGYFTWGKFDQVVRNIPYGALAQAFRNLIWQFLTESEERLSGWRARLSAALGSNSGVLAEVIPEVELVLGKQPPPPPVDPKEAQNRFRYVFQSFLASVADDEHPLVVFLDDLQWADAATLELLHALLTSPEIRHVLLLGAYRDNEVDADHPLARAIERLEVGGAVLHRVSLAPLALPALLAFLRDTLRGAQAALEPLARLILEKTDGNPFFVIQFLKTLVQDGLLAFDRQRAGWSFRMDAIEKAGITDNVVDLMTRKIRRLSPRSQRAVTLAACVGSQFAWDTLLTVSRQPPDEAASGLWEAIEAGLIRRRGDPYEPSDTDRPGRVTYAFLHDRVQQAAYGLIPEDRKKPAHLDVGRLLLADCAGDVPDDRLFEIVNHLNIGSSLITAEAERLTVARLNLAAARKAKTSTAYRSASAYLEQGLTLVDERHWASHYELLYALHLEAAECQYLSGNFDRAERFFRLVLDHAATPLDRAQVHALRITLYENQSRWADAIANGREGLALFGISFPDRSEDERAALDREVALTQQLLAGRPIASLVDLPVTNDPEVRMVMRILTILWAPAYISGDELLARLISATMVRFSLVNGNTEDSAYGYVTHAITIGPMRGDYASAFEWGELALAVNDRFGDRRRRAKIHQQFQAHVNLWRRPFESCIPYAREARRSGLETGDFPYAGYGAASEAWPAFLANRDLDRFVRDYTPTLALLGQIRMTEFQGAHRVMLNWALALQGRTSGRLSLSDATFDEAAFVASVEKHSPFFLAFLYAAKLHLALLLEDFRSAVRYWDRACLVARAGTIWPVVVDAWGSLALAALPVDAGTGSRWDELIAIRSRLETLADNCPENFRTFWLLLSAEMERCCSRYQPAIRLCEEAVAYARDTGNLQHEALANELGARAWIAAGDEARAAPLMSEAHRCYGEWGATVKVRDLEQRYERLLDARRAAPSVGRWATGDARAEREVDAVDMVTVLKLARAIAVEIQLDDLLRTLMTIAMENAGAKRSVFLVASGQELTVEAEATVDPDQVRLHQAVPLEQTDRVPQSLVQYVRRTGQDVVVGNAVDDERFGADPYVARSQTRSILCVPVSHQGRLGGILYLENDLTADAFTPERTEMMRVLAAQAAISLENARLYEGMKSEVERRTAAERALREALTELESLKNRLEAENIYLQEEIQTQHNFSEIVGNSPALREVLAKVERVAPTASTVLIAGETGTGKEIIARAIHSRSTRRERPLVKVNCGAIPSGLVESELFGHVKGAFTGALQKRSGRFELADGGSILLDEVGELPLDTQVKLLRVLQEQEFEPVGAMRPVRVDVRVIAATNRDLQAMVRDGTFRADLFYRLNVFPIHVPPLRERRDDIPLLVAFLLTTLSKRLGKPLEGFTSRSLECLQEYDWPGNVRELQNVVERAAILARGPIVDLQPDLLPAASVRGALDRSPESKQTLEDVERQHILRVVKQTNWTIEGEKGAAIILGMHPNTLRSRMKKLGIARSAFGQSKAPGFVGGPLGDS